MWGRDNPFLNLEHLRVKRVVKYINYVPYSTVP